VHLWARFGRYRAHLFLPDVFLTLILIVFFLLPSSVREVRRSAFHRPHPDTPWILCFVSPSVFLSRSVRADKCFCFFAGRPPRCALGIFLGETQRGCLSLLSFERRRSFSRPSCETLPRSFSSKKEPDYEIVLYICFPQGLVADGRTSFFVVRVGLKFVLACSKSKR